MQSSIYNFYLFLHKIPDYLFPGSIHAYNARLAECKALLVYEFMCLDLYWWRELFHLFGGILLLFIYHTGKEFRGIRILIALFILFIIAQEFVLHPLWHGQPAWKSISDAVFWFVPLVIYERVFIMERAQAWYLFATKEFRRGGKVVEFIKANMLSLVAGALDFSVFSILHYGFNVPVAATTVISASFGGLFYLRFADSWVFKTNRRGLAFFKEMGRFLIVWLESVAWNTFGTAFLARVMPAVTARIVTAIFVGWFWNYPLNKFFVFVKEKKLFKRRNR